MKMNNKKKILIILLAVIVLIAIVVAIVLSNTNKKEENIEQAAKEIEFDYSDSQVDMNNTENAEVKDGLKRATSEKLKEEKMYNDIRIIEAEITATKNRASFIAKVKSDLDKPVEGEIIYVVFLKKDGTELTKLETFFPDLEPNGEAEITVSTNEDIANAYDYYIERELPQD